MLTVKAKQFKEQIVAAITRELEVATELSSGDNNNQIRDGYQKGVKGNSFVYFFNELTGVPPEEGMKVNFKVGEKAASGRYLGEVNSQYQFEIDEDLGEQIDIASISSDPLFLIKMQIEMLKNDILFENKVALASLGLAEYPPVETCHPKSIFAKDLNQLQKEVLNISGKNSVAYIWGPPGTGKTTTMGSLVAALTELDQKVLLISNTNLAVDTALERCLDRYKLVDPISEGLMLRLGTPIKPEIKEKYGPLIDLEEILRKAVIPIQDKILKSSGELQKIKDEIDELKVAKQEFRSHINAIQNLTKVSTELAQMEINYKDSKQKISEYKAKMKSLEKELQVSEAKNAISRLFGSIRNPVQIRLELDQLKNNVDQLEKLAKQISSNLPNMKREVETLKVSSSKSVKWLESNPSESSIENKIIENRKLQVEIQKQIDALQLEISGKRKELIAKARVTACTAYKPLIDKEITELDFDVVIIDEASMIPLSLFYCSAAKAKSRIVVAGDFRQLPPIVKVGGRTKSNNKPSQTDLEFKDLLTKNPFTFSKVLKEIGQESQPSNLIALRDQYRMREPIAKLISDFFYPEHTLKTIKNRMDNVTPWGNETFIVFDTSALNPESSRVQRSLRNIVHALVIKAISDTLLLEGWEFISTAKKSFGILAPFAKQANLIRSLIHPSGVIGIEGGVSTVHRFQGNERDLMILDITKVASKDDPMLGKFLGNMDPLAVENAMWNVGISRARQYVVIVADLPTLKLPNNSGAVISQLVNKMIAETKVIDAAELLKEASLDSIRTLPESTSGSIAWYTGNGFYSAFQKDLKNAKEKVLIASPFTMSSATNRWTTILRDLVAKKVEVTVMTKPLSEKNNAEESEVIHKELTAFIKELREIPKMHEKLAIFDDLTVWLGSLNILSHHKASEIMVRIESPDFAKSISAEYQYRRETRGTKSFRNISRTLKKGDKCDRPGCDGLIREVPAGISKTSGRQYSAFLSCSNYPNCKSP